MGGSPVRGFRKPLIAMKTVMDMGDVTVIPLADDLTALHHDRRATDVDQH
jgi:hypothetical protein